MLLFPNAKINLGLYVTEKRPDGYHNIHSVFYPVPWQDILELTIADSFTFKTTGLHIDGAGEDNLVAKAYRLMHRHYEIPPLAVHLHKNIPMGAGLGGGSSDAAFFINGANEYFELNLSVGERQRLASGLGSDCAFFIENKPALATERGEKLKKINFSLKGYHIAIIHPGIHVSTSKAYQSIVPGSPKHDLAALICKPSIQWDDISNDFEAYATENHPQISDIKNKLKSAGAFYASMTGSGSAVYGLFNEEPDKLEWPHSYRAFYGILD